MHVISYNEYGEKLVDSEACGGVVESNMYTGRDVYLPMKIGKYLKRRLVGEIQIVWD